MNTAWSTRRPGRRVSGTAALLVVALLIAGCGSSSIGHRSATTRSGVVRSGVGREYLDAWLESANALVSGTLGATESVSDDAAGTGGSGPLHIARFTLRAIHADATDTSLAISLPSDASDLLLVERLPSSSAPTIADLAQAGNPGGTTTLAIMIQTDPDHPGSQRWVALGGWATVGGTLQFYGWGASTFAPEFSALASHLGRSADATLLSDWFSAESSARRTSSGPTSYTAAYSDVLQGSPDTAWYATPPFVRSLLAADVPAAVRPTLTDLGLYFVYGAGSRALLDATTGVTVRCDLGVIYSFVGNVGTHPALASASASGTATVWFGKAGDLTQGTQIGSFDLPAPTTPVRAVTITLTGVSGSLVATVTPLSAADRASLTR